MKVFNSFQEVLASQSGTRNAAAPQNTAPAVVSNIPPTSVEFGNMRLCVAGEDPNKPPHVHAEFPGRSIKFLLGASASEVEVAPNGIVGKVTDADITTATKQIKANYDKLKGDYYDQFNGTKIQKITGKKI